MAFSFYSLNRFKLMDLIGLMSIRLLSGDKYFLAINDDGIDHSVDNGTI